MADTTPSWVLHWKDQDGIAGQKMIEDAFTIGRSGSCDVVFDSPRVSRTHARIGLSEGGRPVVEDLQSSNGTMVNGEKVTAAFINAGDTLTIGGIEFWVEGLMPAGDASATQTFEVPKQDTEATIAIPYQPVPEPQAPAAAAPPPPPPPPPSPPPAPAADPNETNALPQQAAPSPAVPAAQPSRSPFGGSTPPAERPQQQPPPPPVVPTGPSRSPFGGPAERPAAMAAQAQAAQPYQQPQQQFPQAAAAPQYQQPPPYQAPGAVAAGTGASATGGYPVQVEVDGPAKQQIVSVLLRALFAIPHLIVVGVLGYAAGAVALISWFVILFTGKMPPGLGNFMANYMHWSVRAQGYYLLLTGQYPQFQMGPDENYPIRPRIQPQFENRNRLTVFFRPIMLIPHLIALTLLGIGAYVVLIISWFAALFTGSVPAGMHNFLAGFLRWASRVGAYYLLITDEYPPFSLE